VWSPDTVIPLPHLNHGGMMNIRSITAGAVAAAVLVLVGATGCASADKAQAKAGSAASSSAGSDQAQALKFAQCMRQHGVDVPDPGQGGGTGIDPNSSASPGTLNLTASPGGIDLNPSSDNAAMTACRQYLPNGGVPQKPTAAQLAQELKFAQCMRQHGIDMPDPNPDGSLTGFSVGSGNPADPATMKKMDDANRACQQYNSGYNQ
jgi:hypothetical protein